MKRLIVLLATVTVGLLGAATPSVATPDTGSLATSAVSTALEPSGDVGTMAYSDCPRSYSCYWEHSNGTGRRWDAPSCGVFVLGDWRNNNFSSVWNRGGGIIHFYDNPNTTGYLGSVRIGEQGNLNATVNNRASSLIIEC